MKLLMTLTTCLLALTAMAQATTYYTANTGKNTNPGTLSAPFKTITYGVSKLHPGDTLYVRAGTYAESFAGNIPSGTSSSSPVTLSAYTGETVTLCPNAGPASVFMFYNSQCYITVNGFIIDATNVSADAIKLTIGGGGGPANHITLQNCEVKNAFAQGILISDGANYNQFLNLSIHDSAMDGRKHAMALDLYHGMYIASDHNLVQGCNIYHNAGNGIQCYDGSGTASHDNAIVGNWCYNNAAAGAYGTGIILSSGSNNVAYNNIVYGNVYGIDVDYSAVSASVYNNTVYSNKEYGLYIGTGSTNAVVENNLAYNNGWPPDITDGGSVSTTYSNNLSGINPLFVNAAGGNFNLLSGSPAINAGMDISLVTTDIFSTARPSGQCTIGAIQYVP